MASGIYKLTFPSGKFYIGKSDNFERRWTEHARAFEKGTHSKAMQEEYNLHQELPTAVILLECHRDHIDLMESIYIEALNVDANCLNGNNPSKVPEEEKNILLNNRKLLQVSTAEHLTKIKSLKKKLKECENLSILDENAQLRITLKKLRDQPNEEANKLRKIIYDQDIELTEAYNTIAALKNKPRTFWQWLMS